MNPFLSPAPALVAVSEPLDLMRLGHRTGALFAAVFVIAICLWLMRELGARGSFLWVHGGTAMLMLVLSAAWGGGLIARRSDGSWPRWIAAVAVASLVCLMSGDLGLFMANWGLMLLRSKASAWTMVQMTSLQEQGFLLSYGYLLALSFTAGAGLFIRRRALKKA